MFCIDECCEKERHLVDEDVDTKRMKDYIVAQMAEKAPTATPLFIVPAVFKDIIEPLADEDYLIMSYRVFGFVLRSRKWRKLPAASYAYNSSILSIFISNVSIDQLDMSCISEVAILGEGEGFDQLVLPPGHGDMVK